MPTATLIRRVGTSSSHSSSVVVELVASSSSDGGSHNSQEVDYCNGTDASISVASSQSKNKIQQRHNEKTVAKKSQSGFKKRIRKNKRCSHEGCANQAVKGGVCITHGAKVTRKQCSFEGCTNYPKKGGVCVTHGAVMKTMQLRGVYQWSYQGRSVLDSWRKSRGKTMQL
jgi:hypothetical protein